jgi:hypothetical protein
MAKKMGASFTGIDYVAFGIIDGDTGKLVADKDKGLSADGVVIVDGDGQGATTANITQLGATGADQYANNKLKRIAYGLQRPQLALTMLDMPFDIAQKIKGYVSDGKGGYVLGKIRPHVAVLVASEDYWGNMVFDAFANSSVDETAHNHGTDNQNEVDYNAALTIQALNPIDDNVFIDPDTGTQRAYKQFQSGDDGFTYDDMLSEVFGGYKDTNKQFANHGKTAATYDSTNQPHTAGTGQDTTPVGK